MTSRASATTTPKLCKCNCGTPITSKKKGVVYIKGHNRSCWKGGVVVDDYNPYTRVWCPGHPRANNGYVYEHILVAEKALGRYISPKHPIHHVNEDKRDNRPQNLVICQDASYHALLHERMLNIAARNAFLDDDFSDIELDESDATFADRDRAD